MMLRFESLLQANKKYGWKITLKMALYYLNILKQHVQYPNSSLKIKVEKGFFYFWNRLEKGREIDHIKFISKIVKKGDTILDVGAWIGDYTFLFSHLVGEEGEIIAFEPEPYSFDILGKNINLNKIKNIKKHKLAISNKIDDVILFSPSSTSREASMKKLVGLTKPELYKFRSKCTTIDRYCLENKIQPDGIKIDVQGEESNVLKGAVKTIQRYNPWCILEFHPELMNDSEIKEMWDYIHSTAKKVYLIEGDEKGLIKEDQLPVGYLPKNHSHFFIIF